MQGLTAPVPARGALIRWSYSLRKPVDAHPAVPLPEPGAVWSARTNVRNIALRLVAGTAAARRGGGIVARCQRRGRT
eukprot:899042-Alexandrium_andersonii.AAC.1